MKRSRGWALKGQTPVVKTPSTRSGNTVIGSYLLFWSRTIDWAFPSNKKRKLDSDMQQGTSRGTITDHSKQFLLILMYMDEYPTMENAYLVMDNASVHKNASVAGVIQTRGY